MTFQYMNLAGLASRIFGDHGAGLTTDYTAFLGFTCTPDANANTGHARAAIQLE
jgi:hypothetical protein